MDVLGIDHVQLAAPPGCEAQARAFYGELLGLTELQKPVALQAHGGVWFSAGAHQIHIGVEDAFSAARKAHPALLVAAGRLDALAERLAADAAPITWDAAIPGVRRCYTVDPWGNRLELVEAPG